jgi:hypothetical protein
LVTDLVQVVVALEATGHPLELLVGAHLPRPFSLWQFRPATRLQSVLVVLRLALVRLATMAQILFLAQSLRQVEVQVVGLTIRRPQVTQAVRVAVVVQALIP